LVVSAVNAPATVFAGQTAEVSWTVNNVGTGSTNAQSWNDDVYLSFDDVLDNTDSRLARVANFSYLGPQESYVNKVTITLPRNLDGQFRFIVAADATDQVQEFLGEGNNSADSRLVQATLPPTPDLQVTSIIAPSSAFSGQRLALTWTVANKGPVGTTEKAWEDAVYLSNDNVFDSDDQLLGTFHHDLRYEVIRASTYSPEYQQIFGQNPPADSQQSLGIFDSFATASSFAQINRVFLGTSIIGGIQVTASQLFRYQIVPVGGPVPAGGSYAQTSSFSLPDGLTGDFFVLVRTDALGEVFEPVSFGNNTSSANAPTHVFLTPPPDLQTLNVVVPAQAQAGRTLHLTHRVANNGTTAVPNSSWNETFYLSADATLDPKTDLKLGARRRFVTLNAGAFVDYADDFTLSTGLTGNFFAFIVADSDQEVSELDRSNNEGISSQPVQVNLDAPDLIVSSVSAPPGGVAGQSIIVSYTVANIGTGATYGGGWTDNILLSADDLAGPDDRVLLGVPHSATLGSGQQYTMQRTVQLPPDLASGTYKLLIVTDAGDQMFESTGEGNNTSAPSPIDVSRSMPDLIVTSVTAPAQAASGQALTIQWTVSNIGPGPTRQFSWNDGIYLSQDTTLSPDDILLTNPFEGRFLSASGGYGGSARINIPIDLAGTFFVIIRADDGSSLDEDGHDQNNTLVAPQPIVVTLSPTPDLRIASVDAPADAFSGQPFDVTYITRNSGQATASGGWYDSVYLSLDPVFDPASDIFLSAISHNSSLAAGDQVQTTAHLHIPGGLTGPYFVFVQTDSTDRVHERGAEDNNFSNDPFSMLVSLVPPADLIVGLVDLPVSAANASATISYTVNNLGPNIAKGSWTDAIYLSTDTQFDSGDTLFGRVQHTGDVKAGDSYSESLTARLPGLLPGSYHVILRSDIRNNLIEADETNNIAATLNQFSVNIPALTLDVPTQGTLDPGGSAYYRVDIPAGKSLQISLDSLSQNAFNELYIRFGALPTRSDHDFAYDNAASPDQKTTVPLRARKRIT
jgi:subtilase family serine protease